MARPVIWERQVYRQGERGFSTEIKSQPDRPFGQEWRKVPARQRSPHYQIPGPGPYAVNGYMGRSYVPGVSGLGDTTTDIVDFLSGKSAIKTESSVSVEASDRTTALVVFGGLAFVVGMSMFGGGKKRGKRRR